MGGATAGRIPAQDTMTETSPGHPAHLRIVPREGHGISRKDISPNALRVL